VRYEWDRRGAVTGDGRPLATIRLGRLRGRADVRLGPIGWTYAARGEQRTARRIHDAEPAYVARHVSWVPSCWEVVDGEHSITLTADKLSHWVTVRRDGVEIGRAGPARSWTSRPCLEVAPPLRPELAVFVLWVHHTASSSAGRG
jgi:hypothetical protein